MNYAGRFNSFILKGQNVFDAIKAYHEMDGITHLEFNYPEHFAGYDLEEIKKAMGDLKVNGLAVRWRNDFTNGDLTNPDPELRERAIRYCKEATDICRELGGTYITLWLENDGFDYAFQVDYEEAWNQMIDAFRELADYAPDMKYSIEYKPFEPRNFSMVDSTGMTLLLIKEIDRPNVGCTLDFCHMLMKRDSPAYGLALAASMGKLYGLHMNDGYSQMDSGMIFGSVNIAHAAEFIYYLKKYNYQGVVFFDTFPIRENAKLETQAKNEFSEANRAYLIEKEKLEELFKKRAVYEAALKEQLSGSLNISEINICKKNINSLKSAIRTQLMNVKKAEDMLEVKRVALNELMKERKTHEKLRDKKFEDFQKEEKDNESKEIDQLVSFTYNS